VVDEQAMTERAQEVELAAPAHSGPAFATMGDPESIAIVRDTMLCDRCTQTSRTRQRS
jgi:hypothetical protein